MKNKIHIDNSHFMELIDALATQITEMNFREETWNVDELEKLDEGYKFTEEAQDYYNEKYDEYEGLFNNIANIYNNE
tara:strand:- start:149 stop:379 length:231 start_codon:yes stop_codon:yes gene_type:complete